MILALLLDLANIAGGFLLAIPLLRRLPRAGDDLGRFADRAAPFGWIVGIVALAVGATYLLAHLLGGGRIYHFEIVGIGVGLALLWERLTGRRVPGTTEPPAGTTAPGDTAGPHHGPATPPGGLPTGAALLLAIFGIIAILVGLQGLFTPD